MGFKNQFPVNNDRWMRIRLLFCLNFAIIGWAAAEADPVPALVEARDVRAIVKDGKHNAFTAMVKWQGAYWLSFRKAEGHESSDGAIIVLRSEDTQIILRDRQSILPHDIGDLTFLPYAATVHCFPPVAAVEIDLREILTVARSKIVSSGPIRAQLIRSQLLG